MVFDGRMAWHESWDLTQELLADPESRVHAAVAGWAHPTTWAAVTLADVFDLTAQIASDRRHKPKPYPRPWDIRPQQYGNTGGRSREQVEAILADMRGRKRDSNGRLHGPDGRYVKG